MILPYFLGFRMHMPIFANFKTIKLSKTNSRDCLATRFQVIFSRAALESSAYPSIRKWANRGVIWGLAGDRRVHGF